MRWRAASRQARPQVLTLHVGTPKSGTTYLQSLLSALRDDLAAAGVLYPGAEYLPHRGLNQQPAVYGVAGAGVPWVRESVRANGVRHLDRMASELRRHRGPALVSAEALSSFGPAEIEALLDALGYPADRIEVLITTRDLGRLLTSVWQENVKNGATALLGEYLDSVTRLRSAAASPFWTAYGLPGLVDRWAAAVGMARVTLVTTPPPARRDELWPRYARACGLDAAALPDISGVVIERSDSNVSLSPSQSELLRQMNAILEIEQVGHDERQRLRARLLEAWMSRPAERSRRLGMDETRVPTVRRWAADDIAALRERTAAGLRVVGDLVELEPDPPTAAETAPAPNVTETAQDLLTVLRDAGRAPAVPARRR